VSLSSAGGAGASSRSQRLPASGVDRHVSDAEQTRRNNAAREDASEKRQVPQSPVLPVVAEELHASRHDGGASVAQVARDQLLSSVNALACAEQGATARPIAALGELDRRKLFLGQ